ncbi:MAG: hypothetical protein VW879_08935, partial [Opitutae bacterium]
RFDENRSPAHFYDFETNKWIDYFKYKVLVTSSTSFGGTVTGSGSYERGQTALLTASPSPGYKFIKWSITDTDTEPPSTRYPSEPQQEIIITENLEIEATFEPKGASDWFK